MQTDRAKRQPAISRFRSTCQGRWRRGSVLLVVLGLLLLLMLLGFTAWTFTSSEHEAAIYYADASKVETVALDSDVFFDHALEQWIVGPHEADKQSALWPGNASLLPNMLGLFSQNSDPNAAQGKTSPRSRQVYTGTGVNIISGPLGEPLVDQDFDGVADASPAVQFLLLRPNYSQAATASYTSPPGGLPRGPYDRNYLINNLPGCNPGYTYPDINSPYLAHIETVNGVQVVKPSFHLPALLRDPNTGQPYLDWDRRSSTAGQVFRPHPEHRVVANTNWRRFMGSGPDGKPGVANVDDDGNGSVDDDAEIGWQGSDDEFPLLGKYLGTDSNNDGYLSQGVWTGGFSTANRIEYDVDARNMGLRDAIWLDLNFPMLTLTDGRKTVPLFAFVILDADGLVNLNTAGNLAGLVDLTKSNLNQFPVSRSNHGLTPSEINPFWVLAADPQDSTYLAPRMNPSNPTDAFAQQRGFFGYSNTDSSQFLINRIEAANMDMLFLLWGRPHYNVTFSGANEVFTLNNLIAGRWGELNQLLAGAQSSPRNPLLFPRPGIRAGAPPVPTANPADAGDDNRDRFEGRSIDDANNPVFDPQLGLVYPAFRHPLDYAGAGSSVISPASLGLANNGMIANIVADPNNPNTPARFPQYVGGYQALSLHQFAFNGALVPGANQFSLLDHADETIVDRRFALPVDEVFSPNELFALQASTGDYDNSLGQSRLRSLMEWNLQTNLQAARIRRHFTTESWDRNQNSFRAHPRRPWEVNADLDNDGRLEFPPVVSLPGGALDPQQPFRTEVRAAIGHEQFNNDFTPSVFNRQLRLSVNRLLAAVNPTQPVSINNPPRFRRLTPHPDNLPSTPIPVLPASLPPSITSAADQEFWARRDRQQMARDIYVLLYMLGGGNDNVNYAAASNADPDGPGPLQRPLYADWQLEEMAQFAINVVDALDPDNVIDAFEYDRNLADGWNLDDNPYTNIDQISANDRGVVFGVEAQTLTLSEVLVLQSARTTPSDHAATAYNDTQTDRFFTFVELQNASPLPVDLSNGAWRIVVQPGLPAERRLKFRYDGRNNQAFIPGNGLYTIGSVGRADGGLDTFTDGAGNTVVRSSDFRVDADGDARFQRICPQVAEPSPPQATEDRPPASNLDLVHNRDFDIANPNNGARFSLTDAAGTVLTVRGGLLNAGTINEDVQIILQRRAHPTRQEPISETDVDANADNPWITVDVFRGFNGGAPGILPAIRNFGIQSNDSLAQVQAHLQSLTAVERGVPLDRSSTGINNTNTIAPNTVGQPTNYNAPASSRVWQPHFDRDFSSVIELLSVPLYGPDDVTALLATGGILQTEGPNAQALGGYRAFVAQAKFLQPRHPANVGAPLPDTNLDNRWYRILEFLEVPSRMLGSILTQYAPGISADQLNRVPGKLQLNTLRHQANLFALLDDPNTFNLAFQDTRDPGRDWWLEFQKARDGIDPLTLQPGFGPALLLPGNPASRPFRGFAHAGEPGTLALERTLLRRLFLDDEDLNENGTVNLPADRALGEDFNGNGLPDGNPSGTRRLFEARIAADLQPNQNLVDYHTRHRLLAKVANQSTNRSHVFFCWITVGFFQAYQPDPNNPDVVVIGKELPDQQRRRGFFVVDRSLLEDAYEPAQNPANPGTFDFRKFVQYRQTLD